MSPPPGRKEECIVHELFGPQFMPGADTTANVSDEALAAAMLPRYDIEITVRRIFGCKLPSVREKSA